MKRTAHYHFNKETLTFEKVERSAASVLKSIGWLAFTSILIGVSLFILFIFIFPSPREKKILQRNRSLQTQYDILSRQVDQMQLVLTDLEQRDNNLYRALLQAEPIPMSARLGATQTVAYYDSIAQSTDYRLAGDLSRKVNLLENAIVAQAKSYTELVDYARTQEVRMENLPAIQPVLNKDLSRVASGYGWRVDPVYHTRRFHEGMDFTAPTGTDIYATGNATVTFVGWKQGYGNCVILSHGFNYETLYAHLHKALVRQGQKVRRGDVIALVGNTGKSTGPHLHYEVHYKGQAVDPRNFYFQDLSPEEYDRMVQLSSNSGQMLD